MSDSEHPEGEPKDGSVPDKPTERKNWFGEIVFWIIAGLILVIRDPVKILYRRTYTRLSGDNQSRQPAWPNIVVGTILSLIAGISVGYELGFVRSFPLVQWVTWGLATILVAFLFVYPLLYLIRFKGSELICHDVIAARAEIHGEHLVFLRSDGKLATLFLLEIVENWSEFELYNA